MFKCGAEVRHLYEKQQGRGFRCAPDCDPAGARTQDPNIKSVVLYQLSYRIRDAESNTYFLRSGRENSHPCGLTKPAQSFFAIKGRRSKGLVRSKR